MPGMSVNETADMITKSVPDKLKLSQDELEEIPDKNLAEFEKALRSEEMQPLIRQFPKVFDIARELLSVKTHVGVHASAVVVSDGDLSEVTPLQSATKCDYVTQFDMWDLENLGLLKFDLLGLKTLIVIHMALDMIKIRHNGFEPDIWNLETNDDRVVGLVSEALTNGVFQFAGDGMKGLLKQLHISSFDDMVAASALFRPGPLENGYHLMYGERKVNPHLAVPPHPSLAELTASTRGLFVYQEQLMKATQILAGFSYTEADMFRKIIGKKKVEDLPQLKEKFLTRCHTHGVIDDAGAAQIWDQMEKFGSYCFNLSHSVAYTYMSYVTAWLKLYFPTEFFAALMSVAMDNKKDSDKIPKYEKEAKQLFGLEFLPVDINSSKNKFTVEDGKIRKPLGLLDGIGAGMELEIMANQPYKSAEEYVYKCTGAVTSDAIITKLVGAGAFVTFGKKEDVLDTLKKAKIRKDSVKTSAKDNPAYVPNLKALAIGKKRQ